MTGRLSYRTVAVSDIDILLDLMHGLQQDDPWSVPFEDEEVRKSLSQLLATPSAGRAFLIRDNQLCVGYLVFPSTSAWSTAAGTPGLTSYLSAPSSVARGLAPRLWTLAVGRSLKIHTVIAVFFTSPL
jgi:hypothetical protein